MFPEGITQFEIIVKPYTVERDGRWHPALEVRNNFTLPEITYEHVDLPCTSRDAAQAWAELWAREYVVVKKRSLERWMEMMKGGVNDAAS